MFEGQMNKKTLLELAKQFRKDLYMFKCVIEIQEKERSGSNSPVEDEDNELVSVFGDIENCITATKYFLLRRENRKLRTRESRQTDSGYSTNSIVSTSSLRLSNNSVEDATIISQESQKSLCIESTQTIPTQETSVLPPTCNVEAGYGIETLTMDRNQAQENEETNDDDKMNRSLKNSDKTSENPKAIVAHPADESSEEEETSVTFQRRRNEPRFENNEHRVALFFDNDLANATEKPEEEKDDDNPSGDSNSVP
ncbi:hypothetical protein KUTeg_004362 [Tegillarca granosa]|uniref:Uncharacterized protein n=1 Tax=Tegillarca granosa TaxID=220873 RepID=A0ABQ9FSX5_TEGGR|nr:hypothetical protein KUTeg_004362 [Tegillarca granosa]